MSNKEFSLTPPSTPNEMLVDCDDDQSNESSLDYMDYFNNENFDGSIKEKDILVTETCQENVLIFVCHGDNYAMNGNYVRSLALHNLLFSGSLAVGISPSINAIILSGVSTLEPDPHIIPFNHLFMKIRKNIQILERLSKPNSIIFQKNQTDFQLPTAFELRVEIINILKAVYHFITGNDDKEKRDIVVLCIVELLNYLGPIHFLSTKITEAHSSLGNEAASPEFHLLHLHLDVRWWSLAILHQIDTLFIMQKPIPSFFQELHSNFAADSNKSPIDNCLHFVVWDLLTLVERRITKESLEKMYSLSGFPCSCSHELAVSIKHMIDYRSKINNTKNFWSITKEKLLLTLKFISNKSLLHDSSKSSIITFPPSNVGQLEFYHIWWIFFNFAKLYLVDIQGISVPSKCSEILSETKLLRTMIVVSISNQKPTEQELRFYLNCCFKLYKIWPDDKNIKHSDWIAPIWDHFSKCLDSNFMIQGNNLNEFATLCTSPSSMIALVKSLKASDNDGRSSNSWCKFLIIIANIAKDNEAECKSIKGRIYSKYYSKKMAELCSMGLYNTNLLFLVFATCYQQELAQVCVKLCELLCNVPYSSSRKHTQVVLGLLSSAYLLISMKNSINPIAERLSLCVNIMVQQFETAADNTTKSEVGQCISLYCEGVKEILDISPDISYGQSNLFGSALNSVLSLPVAIEKKAILSSIHAAINIVQEISLNIHILAVGTGVDMIEVIWSSFQQTFKNLCLSHYPEVIVADILSSLVISSLRFSEVFPDKIICVDCYSTVLPYILQTEDVSHRISMPFLSSLFHKRDSLPLVSRIFPKYVENSVSLVLTALVSNGSSDDVISAVEAIFVLPEISELVPDAPACPFGAFQMLVQSLMLKFTNAEVFQQRIAIREKACTYFENFDKAITNLLKIPQLPSYTDEIFRLIGCIFKNGYSLFYVKGKTNSLLANILQAAILPTTIYKLDKPIESSLSEALFATLPKVIIGLSSLSPLVDTCITRYLKDIFKSYIHRYQLICHPFLIVFNEDSPNNKFLRRIFVDTINQAYLVSNSCSQVHRLLTLSFLLELLQAKPSLWLESICSDLFKPLLDLLLHQEDNNVRRCLTDLLQKVFAEVERRQENLRIVLKKHVQLFVQSQLAWSSTRVFRILDVVAALNKPLILDCLTCIAEVIRETEDKRGSGNDPILRQGYNNLLLRLDVGQEEANHELKLIK